MRTSSSAFHLVFTAVREECSSMSALPAPPALAVPRPVLVPAPPAPLVPAFDALDPIGLDELNAQAALQDRVDTKYVVTLDELDALLAELAGGVQVLEIGGLRRFAYATTYYDTPQLTTYREHLQGRRRRFKCRKRRYVDADRSVFEVKLKGHRGRTVKHAMTTDAARELGDDELAFVRGHVLGACERELPEPLVPSLDVRCRRVTLAARGGGERLTVDLDLELGHGRLRPDRAIVESKSPAGGARADRVLRRLGVRPASGCSKYLFGIALSRPDVIANPLRPALRRHFEGGAPRLVAVP